MAPWPHCGSAGWPASTSGESAGLSRLFLADLSRRTGDLDRAAAYLEDAARHHPEETFAGALLRLQQARLELQRGDLRRAQRGLHTAISEGRAMPALPFVATVGVAVAELALRCDEPERAAVLLGAADALRGGGDDGDPDVARLRVELTSLLGARAFAEARRRGRGLDPEAALAAIERQLRRSAA